MTKCPYCGHDGADKVLKSWRFRFYDVRRMECEKCGKKFNHYKGTSGGKISEFFIKI